MRGSLYESPSYGWTMILDPAVWEVEDAASANGVDMVRLSGWSNGSAVTAVLVETYPGEEDDIGACLAQAEPHLASTWPGATIDPAWEEYTGEVIYDTLSDYGRMAAFIVSNGPGFSGDVVVEVYCTALRNQAGIIYTVATTPAGRYDEGIVLLDRLMFTRFNQARRTSEPRPDGAAPRIGVLEFGLECAPSRHVLAEPLGDIRSLYGAYDPPGAPLPDDQAYVLHASWVANIDAIPSVVDLGRLTARFPADSVRGGDDLLYAPAYYGWLAGASEDAGMSIVLEPGQSVVYLVWCVVDRLVIENGAEMYGYGLDVMYEPVVGRSIRVGQTTMIKSETHEIWTCGAGGGARPRVRLGN